MRVSISSVRPVSHSVEHVQLRVIVQMEFAKQVYAPLHLIQHLMSKYQLVLCAQKMPIARMALVYKDNVMHHNQQVQPVQSMYSAPADCVQARCVPMASQLEHRVPTMQSVHLTPARSASAKRHRPLGHRQGQHV